MKVFSTAAQAEIEAGTAIVSGAVKIECVPPVRVWGGYGTIQIASGAAGALEDYDGIGDRGMAQATSASLGGSEQNVTLSLSGVEPKALELLDAASVRGAPVAVYRLIFKGDGRTLLGAHVFTRGRLDDLVVDEVIGGTATIRAMVETAARGLGRRGGRMRTDTDQRLVDPTDGFFKHVSYAGEKMLAWGGQKPKRAGNVLPGTTGPGVGGGGGVGFLQNEQAGLSREQLG